MLCIISKNTFGEHSVHSIQTNSGWNKNPYGENFAVVPENLMKDIMNTKGFCDITLNEEGTEVVSFIAREIPKLPHEETISINDVVNALLGGLMMNKLQGLEQLRRAIQMFAQSLTSEQALEVATVFPKYVVGKAYKVDEMLSYGTNEVGDPQLYRVVQDHTSQEDRKPDETASLYEPIGLDSEGYPVWSKPSGAHDAYNIGDIVNYNGVLYKSLINGNVYSPDEYPQGWELYE